MSARPGHLVVVGLMGAGKTTVGRALARALGLPFVDNDEVLEDEQHCTAAALLKERGIDVLHAAEVTAARTSLKTNARSVVAMPASAADNRALLAELRPHHVVWLRASTSTLQHRVVGSAEYRPTTESLQTTFDEQAHRRAAAFASVADQIVDVDGRTPSDIVAEIERQLPRDVDERQLPRDVDERQLPRDVNASGDPPTGPGPERGSVPS